MSALLRRRGCYWVALVGVLIARVGHTLPLIVAPASAKASLPISTARVGVGDYTDAKYSASRPWSSLQHGVQVTHAFHLRIEGRIHSEANRGAWIRYTLGFNKLERDSRRGVTKAGHNGCGNKSLCSSGASFVESSYISGDFFNANTLSIGRVFQRMNNNLWSVRREKFVAGESNALFSEASLFRGCLVQCPSKNSDSNGSESNYSFTQPPRGFYDLPETDKQKIIAGALAVLLGCILAVYISSDPSKKRKSPNDQSP